jgi:hypothetical protein
VRYGQMKSKRTDQRTEADLSLLSDPSSLVTTRPVSRILCSSRQMRDFIAFFSRLRKNSYFQKRATYGRPVLSVGR